MFINLSGLHMFLTIIICFRCFSINFFSEQKEALLAAKAKCEIRVKDGNFCIEANYLTVPQAYMATDGTVYETFVSIIRRFN